MTASLNIDEIELPISDKQLHHLVKYSSMWALSNGLTFSTSLQDEATYLALAMQSGFNELMWKVAEDEQFLTSALESVIQVDDFTARLFNIYKQVLNNKWHKPVTLALIRCDYMLHAQLNNNPELRQVEINTMSAASAGSSVLTTELHRQVLAEYGIPESRKNLPDNPCLDGICEGLATAMKLYGRPGSVILFVVTEAERNIFDVMDHVNKIKDDYNVNVIMRSLLYLGENASLLADRSLIVDGLEVAVVYYRYGYVPDHFTSEKEWQFKLMAEKSLAAVCPTIGFHLAGTKKIQQELSRPGVLERYLSDPDMIRNVRSTFAGQYSLELTEEGDKASAMGITNPDNYVMKPQREGGGNNVYGNNIRDALQELAGDEERSGYILMERIRPPVVQNYEVRKGLELAMSDRISELGIFGVLLCKDKEIVCNRSSGHLMRTKGVSKDEGGIQCGNSGIDSPYLI